MLASVVPLHLLDFSFLEFPQLMFTLLLFFQFLGHEQFYSFLPTFFFLALLTFSKGFIDFLNFLIAFIFNFFKVFSYFLFKDFYHLPKVGFQIAFLCSCCVRISGLAVVG